jgi:hypothetical protein
MTTKLPWYIMPVYPFFALAVAAQLAQLWQKHKSYHRILAGIWAFCLCRFRGLCYFVLADRQAVLIIMSGVVSVNDGFGSLASQTE